MYDIKTIEFGTQQHQSNPLADCQQQLVTSATATTPHLTKACSTCSFISSHSQSCSKSASTIKNSSSSQSPAEATKMTILTNRRRRVFQRRACLLSILAAFVFGLALGVFMPLFGFSNVFSSLSTASYLGDTQVLPVPSVNQSQSISLLPHPPSDFPTIYALHDDEQPLLSSSTDQNLLNSPSDHFSVAFIKEQEVTAEQVFRNAFHLEQDKLAPDAMIVKKLDANDGSIKEFRVQRTSDGLFRKGPERRLSKPSLADQVLLDVAHESGDYSLNFVPITHSKVESAQNLNIGSSNHNIIKSDIYWGDLVESALPKGFSKQDVTDWNHYVSNAGTVKHLEPGCGRMQNRLVIFEDGTRACARYRQNTDQIQGELFSFYLGQVLNMTNLAPSAASVVDLDSRTWSSAVNDITQAQWKHQRPVVLTRWLPDLEPAGIPQPFQPLERHLNKYDVWNITLIAATEALRSSVDAGTDTLGRQQPGLLQRLSSTVVHQSTTLDNELKATADSSAALLLSAPPTSSVLQCLIELAQWSDLIVFDYLIANLDRVVNNLYNYQWNADIMAAPAHNLARQTNSELLVFLDNESGLLHGYRLLKKYEVYHGLLLDNLCVFRQPTIDALRQLRTYGTGRRLRELFEQTTSPELRDVLPSLPDKSIKILIDRIDRVLGQVQKCRDLLADR